MRTRLLVPTLLCVSLGSTLAMPAAAQTTELAQFDATESALAGTVACNGGAATPIAQVDASTTDVSGSNDDKASNLSATACALPLYSINSSDDSTSAQDTSSLDDDTGNGTAKTVSLLGGVLTYDSKVEADNCTDTGQAVNCQDTTTIQNLVFGGQHITGQFTQPTTFNAVDLSVQLPGYCTGLALFTGSLTVAGSSLSTNGDNTTVDMNPIALKGTLTCVGLPLASIQVDLQDAYVSKYNIPQPPPPPGPQDVISISTNIATTVNIIGLLN